MLGGGLPFQVGVHDIVEVFERVGVFGSTFLGHSGVVDLKIGCWQGSGLIC